MPLPWCEKHVPSPVHVLNVFPQNCHSGEKAPAIPARYSRSLLFVISEALARSKRPPDVDVGFRDAAVRRRARSWSVKLKHCSLPSS